VLGGVLSPIDNIGPDDLHVKELLARAAAGVREVIIATNPTTEGEATAIYVAEQLKPAGVRVTRSPAACRSDPTSTWPTPRPSCARWKAGASSEVLDRRH